MATHDRMQTLEVREVVLSEVSASKLFMRVDEDDVAREAPVHFLSVDVLVNFTHAGRKLSNELIQGLLLLVQSHFRSVVGVFWAFVVLVDLTLTFVDSLPSDIIDNVIASTHALVYLLCEIESTEGTLGFDLEPFKPTLCMDVVLSVAIENYNFFFRREGDQTNDAVRHLRIFLLVLSMRQVLQTCDVPLQ